MIEVLVSDEIKKRATAYIEKNIDGLLVGKRGSFDGGIDQKIMGEISFLVMKEYLKVPMETDVTTDRPDMYDFSFQGKTIDVKSTYSYMYRNTGKVPRGWGHLVPDSQAVFKIHDYYVWCVLNGMSAKTISKCCLDRACTGEAVKNAPVLMGTKYVVPTRAVPYDKTFPIEKLLAGFNLDAWF